MLLIWLTASVAYNLLDTRTDARARAHTYTWTNNIHSFRQIRDLLTSNFLILYFLCQEYFNKHQTL